jgi:hypothetical protein
VFHSVDNASSHHPHHYVAPRHLLWVHTNTRHNVKSEVVTVDLKPTFVEIQPVEQVVGQVLVLAQCKVQICTHGLEIEDWVVVELLGQRGLERLEERQVLLGKLRDVIHHDEDRDEADQQGGHVGLLANHPTVLELASDGAPWYRWTYLFNCVISATRLDSDIVRRCCNLNCKKIRKINFVIEGFPK